MKRWPTFPLGKVCDINPRLFSSEIPHPDAEVTFVPMVAIDEVSATIIHPEIRHYAEVNKGYTPFRENDVLFAKITPCMQNGKAAIALNLHGGIGFGSTEFHVLRPFSSLLPQWVLAYIRQPSFRLAAEASFTGSAGQQRVPADFLKNIPIPVPPLPEQERIVKLLDEADAMRKLRAEADRRTADLIPAIFQEMFGDVGRCHQNAIIEDVVTHFIDYRGKTPKKSSCGVPLVTAKIVKDGHILPAAEFIPEEDYESWMRRGLPEVGDILFTTEAPLGEVAIVGESRIALAQRILLMRPRKDLLDSLFFMNVLKVPFVWKQIEKRATCSTVRGIRQAELRKIRIPIPPLSLQKEFAKRVTNIQEMEYDQAICRQRMDALFQSMLYRAFNGEI